MAKLMIQMLLFQGFRTENTALGLESLGLRSSSFEISSELTPEHDWCSVVYGMPLSKSCSKNASF